MPACGLSLGNAAEGTAHAAAYPIKLHLQRLISSMYFKRELKILTFQNNNILDLGRKLPFSLRQHLS